MKYICMEDIENLAAQGKKELVLDENTVLMNLARDMARQLGITIVEGSRPAPVKAPSPSSSSAPAKVAPAPGSETQAKTASPAASVPSAREAGPTSGAKPKGCQHGALPVPATRSDQPKSQPGSDGVVDQLVEIVRQSTGKRTGS